MFGKIRTQAFNVFRGPQSIVLINPQDNSTAFYGWAILALQISPHFLDKVESFIVYANPYDESQEFVVLRYLFWDGVAARKEFSTNSNFPLKFPAKFVKIPLAKLQAWFGRFKTLAVPISAENSDSLGFIRRLNLSWEYKSQVFEKIWQPSHEYVELTVNWNAVWAEMVATLAAGELLDFTIIQETYWPLKTPFTFENLPEALNPKPYA